MSFRTCSNKTVGIRKLKKQVMPINHKQKEQTINKVTRKRFINVNTRILIDQLFSQEWPQVRHVIIRQL